MDKMNSILVVDDEPDIRTIIKVPLQSLGYKVYEAENSISAIEFVLDNNTLDLIILDVMMPGLSGFEACLEIRKYCNAPILFLTALTQEDNKLQAYKSGGDDFLGKPFSQSELIMKAESLIRRYNIYKGKDSNSDIKGYAQYTLDDAKRGIYKNGEIINLTDTEYDIVKFLVNHRGKPISIRELYEGVWNEKYFSTDSNTVMVHILKLRRKIEDNPSEPVFIKTVWGKGYQVD